MAPFQVEKTRKGLREIRDFVWEEKRRELEGEGEEEEEEEEEEENQPPFVMDRARGLEAAEYLEAVCRNRPELAVSFELSSILRKFRGELRREEEAMKTQTQIIDFFARKR
ncbi:hypothetical protein PQX77_015364 [Marasmius sp. AFHP31]|nr:hypothetical protein PQX77_015364 [Marasmius sp. AFHP31]